MYLWTNSANNVIYTEALSSGTSNLVFPAVRQSDAGEYRCIAQNEWGRNVTSNSGNLQVVTPGNKLHQ